MDQITCSIISKTNLTPTLWAITLSMSAENAAISQPEPGQFFLIQCNDPFLVYLRRPIFPAAITTLSTETSFALTLQFFLSTANLADPGFAWLLGRQVGDHLDLLGPYGRGFKAYRQASSLLLISSGYNIGPLLYLLQQATEYGINTILAMESARASDLYPTHLLPPAVELRIATLDGKSGNQGSILNHLADALSWADMVCATGPPSFYQQLKQHLDQTRLQLLDKFANVLITHYPLHICGTGVCTFCTLPTTNGIKLACQDGPIFDLNMLNEEIFG